MTCCTPCDITTPPSVTLCPPTVNKTGPHPDKSNANIQKYITITIGPKELMNNYQPTYMDREIVQERINEKLNK